MDSLVSIYKSMEIASGFNIFVTQNQPQDKPSGNIGTHSFSTRYHKIYFLFLIRHKNRQEYILNLICSLKFPVSLRFFVLQMMKSNLKMISIVVKEWMIRERPKEEDRGWISPQL